MFFNIVVIGGGVAGGEASVRLAKQLRGRSLVLISSDPVVYSKMTLSYGLKTNVQSIDPYVLYRPQELEALGVRFLNDTVEFVDASRNTVVTKSGQRIEYETLVLATGSKPRMPKLTGIEGAKNVFTFLSFDDMKRVSVVAEPGRKALVVGSGMIGLLVADALLRRGVKVTSIDILPYPALTAVEEELGKLILRRMQALGARFYGGTTVERLEGDGRVERAILSNGVRVDVDFIIVAIGVEPNIPGGLEKLEIDPSGGLRTNERFQTSIPNIYAVGDCASTIDIATGKLLYRPLGILASYAARLLPGILGEQGYGYKGFLAYQVEEAFNVTFMRVGLNGAELKRLGITFNKAVIEYKTPGVGVTRSLVLVSKGDDRILGWQNVGTTLTSYKSRVFEEAIKSGWHLSELEEKGFRVKEVTG